MGNKKIQIFLTDTERRLLNAIATANGYKNYDRWLHHEIHILEKRLKRPVVLCDQAEKTPKSMSVRPEALNFISKLSSCHCKEMATTIQRFIVYPAIKDYMLNENLKGLLKEARDQLHKLESHKQIVSKIDEAMGW